MDRLFRIDFYPQDWIIDTARLTPELRGIYIQIISLIYANRGPISNDSKWIAGVCGCSSRLVKSSIEKLVQLGFIQLSGEKISQKRAENELNIKRNHLELSSKGGRKKRENELENNNNNNIASTEATIPVPSPSPTPSPTATPTPYISLKRIEEEEKDSAASISFFEWNGEELSELPKDVGKIRLGEKWELPHDWGVMAEKFGMCSRDIVWQSKRMKEKYTQGKHAGRTQRISAWKNSWVKWIEIASKEKAQ